jgi:ketosteroid isomerase-like protein
MKIVSILAFGFSYPKNQKFLNHYVLILKCMKKTLYLLGFCLSLCVVTQAQTKEQKDVATAVETLRKAMVDGDRETLDKISAKELSYGHSNGLIEDKAAFVEALGSGKSDFEFINLADQTISIVGNTAMVRHHLTGKTIDGGQANNVNLGVLTVWQKQNGQWKLLARQAFKR